MRCPARCGSPRSRFLAKYSEPIPRCDSAAIIEAPCAPHALHDYHSAKHILPPSSSVAVTPEVSDVRPYEDIGGLAHFLYGFVRCRPTYSCLVSPAPLDKLNASTSAVTIASPAAITAEFAVEAAIGRPTPQRSRSNAARRKDTRQHLSGIFIQTGTWQRGMPIRMPEVLSSTREERISPATPDGRAFR